MTTMDHTQDQAESKASAPTRLAAVRQDIAQACAKARRDPAEVTLVAVSKTFGANAIARCWQRVNASSARTGCRRRWASGRP